MRKAGLSILCVLAFQLSSQEPSVKFSASTNLVVVDVTVRDRSGKIIPNLNKEDFTVLEDGKPQNISVFEFQKLDTGAPPLPLQAPALKNVPIQKKEAVFQVASPGKVQYQDKRLLVLFFDFSSMQPDEQIRAQQAALKFLGEQMTPADMVAILTLSRGLRVEQDFTNNRDALRDVINSFRIGDMSEYAVAADEADEESGEDTGVAFIADETEFNIFNTDRKLSALESAAKKLALLPEKKALIYFSSGISKTGAENQAQLRSAINAAVRSNVSIYPVDARGLVAMVPGGDASKAAPRGTAIFSGQQQRQERHKFNDQQETLSTLAADTGGKAFLDSNELSLGIVQAQRDLRSYYILGYYSANPAEDGRFRRIQVRLTGQPQARLSYRPGYFARKQFGKFTSEDKEQQLQEALSMGDPFTDLRLAMEVDYFRLTENLYFVPVSLKIPGSAVSLKKKGASEVTEFDFVGQILDDRRKLAGSVRDGIRIKLGEADAAQLAHRTFQYDTGFTLRPGKYRIKVLARDNSSGKMGTFEMRFEVPDLSLADESLKLSSVVWSSQRQPLSAAVGAAEKQKKLLAANPLVRDGQKLVPSVTRVFRKQQSLYVYFEVYESETVAATLSFFDGRIKAFETTPVHAAQPVGKKLPVQFQVPLSRLKPGNYVCQLNIVDELGRKFAFPRAPVVVLP